MSGRKDSDTDQKSTNQATCVLVCWFYSLLLTSFPVPVSAAKCTGSSEMRVSMTHSEIRRVR